MVSMGDFIPIRAIGDTGRKVAQLSCDHPMHGYLFPIRGEGGGIACDIPILERHHKG